MFAKSQLFKALRAYAVLYELVVVWSIQHGQHILPTGPPIRTHGICFSTHHQSLFPSPNTTPPLDPTRFNSSFLAAFNLLPSSISNSLA